MEAWWRPLFHRPASGVDCPVAWTNKGKTMDKDAYNRETRISRAYREVIPHYSIERQKAGPEGKNQAVFRVRAKKPGKASSDYTVTLSSDWSTEPACTCPDTKTRLVLGGYCKHVIAVLLTQKDLSCQLLELFLGGD